MLILPLPLRLHANSNQDYICDQCSQAFSTLWILNSHIRKVHEAPGKVHKCLMCNYEVNQRSELYEHLQEKHAESRTYKCDFCERTYFDNRQVENYSIN